MKLMVGVSASWEALPTEFVISYLGLFRPVQIEALAAEGVIVSGPDAFMQVFGRAFPLDYNRNQLLAGALANKCDALVFLDADMIFPVDMLVSLVRQFKANPKAGMISGVYFKKVFPYHPVNANFLLNRPQHMFPIELDQPLMQTDIVGMGCVIIRTEAVVGLPKPWFEYRRDLIRGEAAVTEDVAFCCKMREAGWDILTDTRITCGHLTRQVVDVNSYRMGETQIKADREKQKTIEAAALKVVK